MTEALDSAWLKNMFWDGANKGNLDFIGKSGQWNEGYDMVRKVRGCLNC